MYHLAKQGGGMKVGGIEQFSPGHDQGSSHGESRITRLAYYEGPEYYTLVKRSLELVMELGSEIKQSLFLRTGMLDVHGVFERSLECALHYKLEHEIMSGADVNKHFPGYRLPEHWRALYQPDGGILSPEAIVQAHCQLAQQHGARLHVGEKVLRWAAGQGGGGGVEVVTDRATYTAGQVVFAGGAWMSALVPELKTYLQPVRQVVAWFAPEDPQRTFRADAFPVFVIQEAEEEAVAAGQAAHVVRHPNDFSDTYQSYYGFPQFGATRGFKLGKYNHLHEAVSSPSALSREFTAADEAALRSGVSRYFPDADRAIHKAVPCMFTNTPDTHFLIDRHPVHPQVILCSACSGHGFKMSPGGGELLADIAVHGGKGSDKIQEVLRIHRLGGGRLGHEALMAAFLG